ncbi:calcium-binding protein [Sphingomonas japonica]|uniref:EF-hand domain-containing protein n=1 Tax=Sphingomonas japonica TaxID=511662 RepID=A0ABX0U1M3_9SPHN|nr:calcium-binding protein [Sphingomonas japonica]NIJ24373.1 hypothetical protein [Sphingomonas japonica]
MTITVPALAQEVPAQETSAPTEQTVAPTTSTEPSTTMGQTTPTEPVPASPAQTAETIAPMDEGQEAPVASAEAAPTEAPAATGTEVADVVNAEFPTYDKDADGELKSEEFGQWMIALRSASDPATDAQSAEVKSWVDQAFTSADADKSDTVDKTELTGFLSQGAS